MYPSIIAATAFICIQQSTKQHPVFTAPRVYFHSHRLLNLGQTTWGFNCVWISIRQCCKSAGRKYHPSCMQRCAIILSLGDGASLALHNLNSASIVWWSRESGYLHSVR
eukprot:scpid94256/ scgid9109/ 